MRVQWSVMHQATVSFGMTLRLCTIQTKMGETAYQNLTYDYDGVGNIKSIVDPINGNQGFGYDALNRLTSATGAYGAIAYDYDSIGNMTRNTQVGTYNYPTNGIRPHAVTTAGANTYTYDANGNMIGGAGRSLIYNVENRPITVTTASSTTQFLYDGDGGRVKKTVNGVTTVYIGKLYECTNGRCSKYIFAGSQRIALKPVGSAEIFYYHSDHLGSSSVMTDATGKQVQNIAYLPYGATRANTGSVNIHHKYTGQELDDSTGLYFYNARYYDPVLGRFISADTIVPNPGNPQDLNRYSYASNNPLRYIDPSGHQSHDFSVPNLQVNPMYLDNTFSTNLSSNLTFNMPMPDLNFGNLTLNTNLNLTMPSAANIGFSAPPASSSPSMPIGTSGVSSGGLMQNNPILYVAAGDWWDLPENFERALEIAHKEGAKRPVSHNDIGDAMRHSEWMRKTTEETNSFTAWIAGTGHEIQGILRFQPLNELLMDLHNNSVGRDAGRDRVPVDPGNLWTLPLSPDQRYLSCYGGRKC